VPGSDRTAPAWPQSAGDGAAWLAAGAEQDVAARPGPDGTPEPGAGAERGPRPGHHAPNGYATAAVTLAALGVTLITLIPALVYAVLGLRRARRRGSGAPRCWLAIAITVCLAALAGFVLPHLIRAADPGCAAYKGPALTAYNKVIGDFSGTAPATVTTDISRAITELDAAAARSHSPAASQDLLRLSAQLKIVRADIKAGKVVPASVLNALNRAAADTDTDCGTLRL
jgi:hypothetical protein